LQKVIKSKKIAGINEKPQQHIAIKENQLFYKPDIKDYADCLKTFIANYNNKSFSQAQQS